MDSKKICFVLFIGATLLLSNCRSPQKNDVSSSGATSTKRELKLEDSFASEQLVELLMKYDTINKIVYCLDKKDSIFIGKHFGTLDIPPIIEVKTYNSTQFILVTEFINTLGITYDNLILYKYDPLKKSVSLVCSKEDVGNHSMVTDSLPDVIYYDTDIKDNTFVITTFYPFNSAYLNNKFSTKVTYRCKVL